MFSIIADIQYKLKECATIISLSLSHLGDSFTSAVNRAFNNTVSTTICRDRWGSDRVYDASANVKGFHLNSPRNRGSLDKRPGFNPGWRSAFSQLSGWPKSWETANWRTGQNSTQMRRCAMTYINFPFLPTSLLLPYSFSLSTYTNAVVHSLDKEWPRSRNGNKNRHKKMFQIGK